MVTMQAITQLTDETIQGMKGNSSSATESRN